MNILIIKLSFFRFVTELSSLFEEISPNSKSKFSIFHFSQATIQHKLHDLECEGSAIAQLQIASFFGQITTNCQSIWPAKDEEED